jgi:hypothetical protein
MDRDIDGVVVVKNSELGVIASGDACLRIELPKSIVRTGIRPGCLVGMPVNSRWTRASYCFRAWWGGRGNFLYNR